jgi:hypothetical protein
MAEWRYNFATLDLSTEWKRVVNLTFRPVYLRRKSARYHLDRRLGEPHNLSGHCEEKRTILLVPRIEPVHSSPLSYLLLVRALFRMADKARGSSFSFSAQTPNVMSLTLRLAAVYVLSDNTDSAVEDPSMDRQRDSFEVNYVCSP